MPPVQVAGDAAIAEGPHPAILLAMEETSSGQSCFVAGDPGAQLNGELGLFEKQVGGIAHLDIFRPRNRRARMFEVGRIEHPCAILTLVAARVGVIAVRAGADHITVGQEAAIGG